MKKYIILIAIIILVKSLTAFYGYEVFKINLGDTKSNAMGNCYLSASQPATAAIYDPALLGEVEQTEASFNMRFKTGSFDYVATSNIDFGPSEKKRGTISPHLKVSSVGVAFPLVKAECWQLGMGLAYHTFVDYSAVLNYNANHDVNDKGGKNAFVSGFGFSLMKQFNLGISYHNSFYSRSITTGYNNDDVVYEMPGDFLLFSSSYLINEKTKLSASYKIVNTIYYPSENLCPMEADILTLGVNQKFGQDNLVVQFSTIFNSKFYDPYRKDVNQLNIGYNHFINPVIDIQTGAYHSYTEIYNSFINIFGLTSGLTIKSGKTIDFNIAADYSFERRNSGRLYNDQIFKVFAGLTYKQQ